jgi:hypothetical protein
MDRRHGDPHQGLDGHAGPVAVAPGHGQVVLGGLLVDREGRVMHPQIDVRMRAPEAAEPGRQPAGREDGAGAEGHGLPATSLGQAGHGGGDRLEGRPERVGEVLAFAGQVHLAHAAFEQAVPRRAFQGADLVADRGRRQPELGRRRLEAEVPGGRLEGPQAGEGGKGLHRVIVDENISVIKSCFLVCMALLGEVTIRWMKNSQPS